MHWSSRNFFFLMGLIWTKLPAHFFQFRTLEVFLELAEAKPDKAPQHKSSVSATQTVSWYISLQVAWLWRAASSYLTWPFLRIRGSAPTCLVCYQRRLEVKKQKTKVARESHWRCLLSGHFSCFYKARAMRKTSVFLLPKIKICWPSWTKEECTSAWCLQLHSTKISHLGRDDQLAKLFITSSRKTLKS